MIEGTKDNDDAELEEPMTTKIMTTKILAALGLSAALAGCNDSEKARSDATFSDKPADVSCWTYGTQTYQGRSTGKVSHRDDRTSFVDAATGRYTVIEGDCRLVYVR